MERQGGRRKVGRAWRGVRQCVTEACCSNDIIFFKVRRRFLYCYGRATISEAAEQLSVADRGAGQPASKLAPRARQQAKDAKSQCASTHPPVLSPRLK